MTSKSSNKGVKLSLSEFMGAGGGNNNAHASLPKGPAERAPDDDGAFKRPVRRSDMDQPPSRSEDGNWRRGSGATSTASTGNTGSGYDNSRGGGGGFDNGRGGGGGFDNGRGGGSGFDSGRGSSNASSRGGGGYNRDSSGTDFRTNYNSNINSSNNWRGGGSSSSNSHDTTNPSTSPSPKAAVTGERPRLQLKSRTLPPPVVPTPVETATAVPSIATSTITKNDTTTPETPVVTPEPIKTIELESSDKDNTTSSKKEEEAIENSKDRDEIEEIKVETTSTDVASPPASTPKHERKEKTRREPEVINSRAAAFGAGNSGGTKNESNSDRHAAQGPPPVLNSRFDKLLVGEERERKSEQDRRPLTTNSRFAAVADADRSTNTRSEDRGPLPVANSRFAAAAAADADYVNRDSREQQSGTTANRHPEPAINSRFAAAADADRSHNKRSEDRGPPPVANSRFAAAAAADSDYVNRDHREQQQSGGRFNDPPSNSRFSSFTEASPDLPVNSRFAAAAAADTDYVNRDSREQQGGSRFAEPAINSRFAAAAEADRSYNKRQDDRGPLPVANSRFAAAAAADGDYVNREMRDQSGGRFGDRGGDRRNGPYDGNRGGRMQVANDHVVEPPPPPQPSRVDELLKPKKQDDVVLVPLTKEHEENMLKLPGKAFKKDEETFLAPVPKKVQQQPKIEEKVVLTPVVSEETAESLLAEFSSGELLGEELKEWCVAKQPLPSIEKLLFHMLKEREKLNPDPNCAWAEPSKYGTALTYLIAEDLYNQMQILWAIQLYCETLGFPKVDGESVVQSMFRAMYKYDLAEADAFLEWKEDESDAHEKGKMTCIVQTIDWFNWLEADDEEEGEDEEEME